MNPKYAKESLRALSEQAADREYEINSKSSNPIRNSDDEADLECPIFDSLYQADGNKGITKMIYFTANDLRNLYNKIHTHVVANWNASRGKNLHINLWMYCSLP